MAVANTGTDACTQDVGSGANEIKILASSGKVVFSSDDCNPSKAIKRTDLMPADPWSATVTWDGRASSPGCPGNGAALPVGTYSVIARNGTINSEPVTLTIK
jgi:hypothetical protein